MAADRRLALHATLPDRYAHVEVLASTIDHLGRIVALLADPAGAEHSPPSAPSSLSAAPSSLSAAPSSVPSAPSSLSAAGSPLSAAGSPFSAAPSSLSAAGSSLSAASYDATAIICDGAEVHEIPLRGLDLRFNDIDVLDDGVVLSAARCAPTRVPFERRGEPVPEDELHLTENVRVFDSRGQVRTSFYAGDGIEQLVTDPHGTIWISYFDESNYWYPRADGTRSYGFMNGLARWDRTGGDPWMVPFDTPEVSWCDCYAMNVGRDRVHACPYPDFVMVELGPAEVRSITPNPITRCSGLAVAGAEFALFDQDRVDDGYRWSIRRGRRDGDEIVEVGREQLLLPDGRHPSGWGRGKIGRDEKLYLHENGNPRRWYRYDLDPATS
ncbi:hypothetical protein BJY16_007703 [Actinoplanes octamycinicus]|uniref:Uncharacterized protein n=1 Tax=Actinoplanes octamycinicus TaxID=135948 RepID=A0A7W7MBL2_9ACTN|nr:hypothetical protein [Actinoplanes octamycinicus]MBB4744244.1 hypothetical protein [Actinoplanes octamycinicus]GIE56798.1 hypothetical protein Aoc01nite_22000 [Actinoplanes octamycinicus]